MHVTLKKCSPSYKYIAVWNLYMHFSILLHTSSWCRIVHRVIKIVLPFNSHKSFEFKNTSCVRGRDIWLQDVLPIINTLSLWCENFKIMAINYRFICYHLRTDMVMRLSSKKYRSNSMFVCFDYFIFVHISVIIFRIF